MNSLFGVPMGALASTMSVLFLLAFACIAALGIRHRVFLRMALRNIPRRRGRSMLIVLGLMLGTLIITAAFSTGDTMSHTVRTIGVEAAGEIDELISVQGANVQPDSFAQGDVAYFDGSLFDDVEAVLRDAPIDGLAPIIREDVAVRDAATRQSEPRVTLFAAPPDRMAGFGDIRSVGNGVVSLGDLGEGQVYVNEELAEEASIVAGGRIELFTSLGPTTLTVADVVRYTGALAPSSESVVLMPLDVAQRLLGREGEIRHIIVSNTGGDISGAERTDEVMATLEGSLPALGLESEPFKEDILELADEVGSGFTSIFATFGTFSVIAGMMLIFLIFVMLAAERKTEMGIARAVGTQRRHLIEMFAFEGAAYDIAAAAVGAGLGILVSLGMGAIAATAFAEFDVDIQYDLRWRSVVVAYTLGVLLTFAVVVFSAWRVSRLNIVTAIRNLPDTTLSRGGRGLWFLGALSVFAGALLIVAGRQGELASLYHLGISIVIIGPIPLLRRLGAPDRVAYTIPGVLLVGWWLFPWRLIEFLVPEELAGDLSLFLISGIMVVIGATWVVMYNADLLLGALAWGFGRFRRLAPAVRMAIAYPITHRFRTGLTVAMFSLIVFTLVVMATINNAFFDFFDDDDAFGGGFDLLAISVPANPIDDIEARIAASEELDEDMFGAIGSQSVLGVDARQVGEDGEFESYPLRGLDETFLRENQYELAIIADGYESEEDVWRAIAERPNLAVIDSFAVPRRDNFGFIIGGADFGLDGFFLEDEGFQPVDVDVIDPETGDTVTITVIGVLKDTFPPFMFGMSTSAETMRAAFGDSAPAPSVYMLQVAGDADPRAAADALESEFFENGMEAEVLAEELDDLLRSQLTLNYIIEGFMALGLLVGVTALGVISARSVAERRQEIGVLRAIGFNRRLVQASFLIESSFIALVGIVVGASLALVVVYELLYDMSEQPATEGIAFAVPWGNLAIVFGGAYLAALLATALPAYWASRVYPAEALRYE